MHRFFLPTLPHSGPLPAGEIDLSPLAHQLSHVLRLAPGAVITVLDGQGAAYRVELLRLERGRAAGRVLEPQPCGGEPRPALSLYQCSLKADKFEWVLQKGVELGVARFVPVVAERSVVRPAAALAAKAERWRRIIQEAAEQCGRSRLPILAPPLDWSAAVADGRGARFLLWERQSGAPALGRAACALLPPALISAPDFASASAPTEVSLLVGPEGGVAAHEAAQAAEAGWQVVTLGPRILRAETAALAAVTVVMERLGELS